MSEHKITISDRCATRIAALRDQQGDPELMLRLSVSGGGCSGFQYGFDFDKDQQDDDHIFEKNGIKVIIDEMSLELMDGAEIDFVQDLMGASFKIKNPNATSECGCGTSFSI